MCKFATMNTFHAFLCALFMLFMAGCGHSDTYRMTGTLNDGSTQNMRVLAYSGGAVGPSITAALEGKFDFEHPLREVALIELYDNDYHLLARFIARPGDDISLEIDHSNRYLNKVDGNADSREWTSFLNSNAAILADGTPAERNALIADYVGKHPESRVSEMLLLTEFEVTGHEDAADSLYRLLSPELLENGLSTDFGETVARMSAGRHARISPITYIRHGNYTETFDPAKASLNLYVLEAESGGRDTIQPEIKKLARLEKPGCLAILDLGLHQDSIPWSREVRGDSATWAQGWLAGGVSAPVIEELAVPQLPYYIIADSTGTQLWRGPSLTLAVSEIMSRI